MPVVILQVSVVDLSVFVIVSQREGSWKSVAVTNVVCQGGGSYKLLSSTSSLPHVRCGNSRPPTQVFPAGSWPGRA